jgi:2'-hydroxyisoflavone reductase
MHLLILGGTRFLGRSLAASALATGHRVTLFHRGTTGSDLFPNAEHVRGDRAQCLGALAGRKFDACIDTCGFVPRLVRESADTLRERVPHYTFVSSLSVYAEGMPVGYDESAALGTLTDPTTEEVTGESYGPLKAQCEREVDAAFPGRALHVRLGLIVGPNDYTDRFPYWVRRIAAGGNMLVPDVLGQRVQFVDVRDAAAWILRGVVERRRGPFNLTGPLEPLTFGEFLERCRAALNPEASFEPVDGAFLLEQGVTPWTEMPLWAPSDASFLTANCGRAIRAGLAFRPLEETLHDTLRWSRETGPARMAPASTSGAPMGASLTAERERELLELWKERSRVGSSRSR